MTCKRVRAQIAALHGSSQPGPAIRAHLASCALCRRWNEDHQIEQLLKSQPAPQPSALFLERAFARAAEAHSGRRTRNWGIGPGIAAVLLMAVAVTLLFESTSGGPASPAAPPSMTRTVNVVIDAKERRSGALLTVELTEDLELEGYGGRRLIQWQTDLSEGRNLLSLPVRVKAGAAGNLRVALSYGGGTHKEMHIPVRSG